jgi:hypothetical protein
MLAVCASAWAQDVAKPIEEESGWKPIFDGKGHQGFRGLIHNDFLNWGWHIEDNVLTCPKEIKQMGKVTGGSIITVEQYLDFEFSWEWKLSVSGITGVMYFATGTPQKPAGFIYQIVDDTHHPDGLKGGPIRRTGSLLGIIPPSDETKKLNPPDSWNEGKIIVQGNHVEHWLNGAKILEYDLGSPQFLKAVAASGIKPWPGFGRKMKTAIVILDEGEEITFRNLKVRDLTPPPKTATTAR